MPCKAVGTADEVRQTVWPAAVAVLIRSPRSQQVSRWRWSRWDGMEPMIGPAFNPRVPVLTRFPACRVTTSGAVQHPRRRARSPTAWRQAVPMRGGAAQCRRPSPQGYSVVPVACPIGRETRGTAGSRGTHGQRHGQQLSALARRSIRWFGTACQEGRSVALLLDMRVSRVRCVARWDEKTEGNSGEARGSEHLYLRSGSGLLTPSNMLPCSVGRPGAARDDGCQSQR